ncbi:MAG: tRNA 2-thiouridine(34) synthase MnmA [Deltaproteobacteria bacterium]|jgi:tRNA-specific 2-thiouridylase|nr:tRNA 2-thiouridine(34) synthase MnmA [Deltaproteobacteria bacterium]
MAEGGNRRGSKKTVLVGLSGGVDSSVAALLLLEQGYTVIGATMSVYDGPAGCSGGNACYDRGEAEDIAAAASLAESLGIRHLVFDCAEAYKDIVLDYFRKSYLAGKTPNPCVRCNHMLKFGLLPDLARRSGLAFDYFATGHYARVEFSRDKSCFLLRRGLDRRKDQSYFLYRLNQEQLRAALFPLGDMTKGEVRALAAQYGLPMHDKPDSQDFYSGGHTELLGMAERPGNIVDAAGTVLGRHAGYWRFTPGQRRGLGLAAAAPLYVLRVNPERNEVVVGERAQSLSLGCRVGEIHLHLPLSSVGADLWARLRSSQPPLPVTVRPEASGRQWEVDFSQAQSGVAPGQSLVLYQEDLVVGGGIIQ